LAKFRAESKLTRNTYKITATKQTYDLCLEQNCTCRNLKFNRFINNRILYPVTHTHTHTPV